MRRLLALWGEAFASWRSRRLSVAARRWKARAERLRAVWWGN